MFSPPSTINVIMKIDLKALSVCNVMCKYVDDINLLAPEHTDIHLVDEFLNFRSWAKSNKMTFKFEKTKYIVFRRPCLVNLPPALNGTEQFNSIKFLGIILQSNQRLF